MDTSSVSHDFLNTLAFISGAAHASVICVVWLISVVYVAGPVELVKVWRKKNQREKTPIHTLKDGLPMPIARKLVCIPTPLSFAPDAAIAASSC